MANTTTATTKQPIPSEPRSRNSSTSSLSSSSSSSSSSSTSSTPRRRSSPLSIDLSTVPPLIQPTPPSNTLLVTNLTQPTLFHPIPLAKLESLISTSIPASAAPGRLHTFSPLPSLRRIVLTFTSTAAAVAIKKLLDGESLSSSAGHPSSALPETQSGSQSAERIRIYFTAPTPLHVLQGSEDRFLGPPKSGKQFFISPPPSPPAGWEVRDEDPPNREAVCPGDLAEALGRIGRAEEGSGVEELRGSGGDVDDGRRDSGVGGDEDEEEEENEEEERGRGRSASMKVLYRPGRRGGLPAIAVEDTTGVGFDFDLGFGVGAGEVGRAGMEKTARPPVELMG